MVLIGAGLRGWQVIFHVEDRYVSDVDPVNYLDP